MFVPYFKNPLGGCFDARPTKGTENGPLTFQAHGSKETVIIIFRTSAVAAKLPCHPDGNDLPESRFLWSVLSRGCSSQRNSAEATHLLARHAHEEGSRVKQSWNLS